MLKSSLVFLLALAAPLTAHADAVGKLKNFIATVRTAQANFTQEVLDAKGRRIQAASGTMQFARPGKFRWSYRKPYEQIMVGDGVRFWLYDVDLNQVTVKKLDAALGGSPAALLSGSHEIERDFYLKNAGCEPRAAAEHSQAASHVEAEQIDSCGSQNDGLEWLEARPKSQDTSFESIRMAFDAHSDLAVMELRDKFGHVTLLHFSDLMRNPKFPPELFKFSPPKGADVLGE